MEKHELPKWATVDPWNMSTEKPYVLPNLGNY